MFVTKSQKKCYQCDAMDCGFTFLGGTVGLPTIVVTMYNRKQD